MRTPPMRSMRPPVRNRGGTGFQGQGKVAYGFGRGVNHIQALLRGVSIWSRWTPLVPSVCNPGMTDHKTAGGGTFAQQASPIGAVLVNIVNGT